MRHKGNKYDVIIIGGGASGLIAGCRSAIGGKKTLILEKMSRPGRKLRITGKGRCNLTNMLEVAEFLEHAGPDPRFLYQVFNQFYNTDLIKFFNSIGLKTIVERGGRVFPESGKATDVVDVLVNNVKKYGVDISSGSVVNKLIINNKEIEGVTAGKVNYYSKKVIVATGGITYPLTGSSGDGYSLARSAGHKINKLYPVLVPLKTNKNVSILNGLNLRNINLTAISNGRKIFEMFGEMSFPDRHLSGPVILRMSRKLVPLIETGNNIVLHLDMKPALDTKKLDNRIIRDLDNNYGKPLQNVLRGLMPGKMIRLCLSETRLRSGKPCNQVSFEERKSLISWLKNQKFEISGYGSADEAIITAGGVEVSEINPKTMESRLIKGLFFAGELIDIEADTGGFNLQIAFSTGWVAGG